MAINREFTQLFKVITLVKCVLTIQDLNWNQRFRDKKTNVNICHHMVTSSTQLQNRSFHVAQERERLRNVKNETARAKRAKLLFFAIKFAYLTKKNSTFARFARAFFVFLHFTDALVLSTTRNDLFCSCVDDVSIWWQMSTFVFLPLKRLFQFNARIVREHFSSLMT